MKDCRKAPCGAVVVATRNPGKLREIASILDLPGVEFLSLKDFPEIPEVAEDGHSFAENARKKAATVARLSGRVAVADDSGLTVDALGGRPGIYSARYGGEKASDEDRYRKLLAEMETVPEEKRGGFFVCAAAVASPSGEAEVVEEKWRGAIARAPQGTHGFGYDPVFFIPEENRTVAELEPAVKNRISHRARAFEKLKKILPNYLAAKS
jgi:non-canonical purine NTP pyrophosphatase (RdgB/HAM1 family)